LDEPQLEKLKIEALDSVVDRKKKLRLLSDSKELSSVKPSHGDLARRKMSFSIWVSRQAAYAAATGLAVSSKLMAEIFCWRASDS
jgi:hypothetical protein